MLARKQSITARGNSIGMWCLPAFLMVFGAMPAVADFADARCDIYTAGSSKPNKMVPCRFSQRQGFVTITRNDGAVHELKPVGDAVGNFRDQDGRNVFRQSGLGDQGLFFQFPDESVYVYWSTVALQPGDPGNPTAPFTTDAYDTTRADST